ncbi:MAG: hypothetical protein SNH57_01000 [Rikenellaceae bacterium]
MYFAYQNPLRTKIADRDDTANIMDIGVAISGKTEVDVNDWAKFDFDESLLDDTGLTLLPPEYYVLADDDTFRVTKINNFIADVQIDFTEAFYNDETAATQKYALPFILIDTTCDSVLQTKYYSIVAIKYQSKYHGTYYNQGYTSNIGTDATYTVQYNDSDLSQNLTVAFSTLSRYAVSRTGQTLTINDVSVYTGDITLTVDPETLSVDISAGSGNTTYVADSGTATMTYDEETEDCIFTISYQFTSGGLTYYVSEKLTRRQDPLYDLRVEYWN